MKLPVQTVCSPTSSDEVLLYVRVFFISTVYLCISYICTSDVSSFTAGTATTSTMFVRRALDDRSTVPVHKFPRWYANFCERYREWSFSPALITRFSRSRMNNYAAAFQERRLIRQKPESVPSYTDRKFAIPICKWSKRVLIVSPD